MALVAADLTTDLRWTLGGGKVVVFGTWAPSGTYTSGGEDLTRAIALAALGLKTVVTAIFTPLCPATPTTFAGVVFDHKSTASSWGKIHVLNAGVPAHTHDILIIGGQTAQTHAHDLKSIGGLTIAESLGLDSAFKFGKNAATDRTSPGSTSATTGGVMAASTPTALSMISTDTLGKEEATNRTIAGSASATKGGVVAAAAVAAASEAATSTDFATLVFKSRYIIFGTH